MDFGVVGLDGFVCSDTGFASDPETKLKWYGSGFNKQQRSNGVNEDDWRDLKIAKTSETMAMQRSNGYGSLISDGQQMLSFSAPNSHSLTGALPYYHQTSTAYGGRNTGYGSCASMHGVLTGPFTSSQWMELEHQALIYKYITANAPVPSSLLIPIRKALESAGFSNFPGGHLKSTTLGWGGFHLGFSNTDPEPGRCRRTDGKKWRCSRDAVADQKYCERHINRGRHRSRKPVEGQSGHDVPGPTTAAKLIPLSSSTSAAVAAVVPGGGSNGGLHHHQLNNLQPGAIFSVSPHLDRSFPNKAKADGKIQNATGPMLSSTIGLKENQFSIPKHHNPYEEPLRTEFGLVYSDSLLNPLHKSSSLMSCGTYISPQDLNCETKSQNSLHQFMDDWPKNQSSTSSPTNETVTLSPLRLSREFDSAQMGLGVGLNEQNQKQANWVPVPWENSMGGPLGEVLHSTSNGGECKTKNTSAHNLMTDAWDSSSPQMTSSPTGVLQKTTFRSLSNSSAGSSPRTENNSLLGSTLVNSSLPAL